MKNFAFIAAAALLLSTGSIALAKKQIYVPYGQACPAGFESAGVGYEKIGGKWTKVQVCRQIHPMR